MGLLSSQTRTGLQVVGSWGKVPRPQIPDPLTHSFVHLLAFWKATEHLLKAKGFIFTLFMARGGG